MAAADLPAIRAYTTSLWGTAWASLKVEAKRSEVQGPRSPGAELKRQLHERDGHHCRFCGIPLIRPEVRKHVEKLFPDMTLWGNKDAERHAALLVMWTQYDHVEPYSRGGATTLDNMVLTCAPCNFGRDRLLVEEVGLLDPRLRSPRKSDWLGLVNALSLAPAKQEVRCA